MTFISIPSLGSAKKVDLDREIGELHQEVAQSGGDPGTSTFEKVKTGTWSALKGVLDIASRPAWAVAGGVDELLSGSGDPGRAIGRAGTEIFSGIGGLEGQKMFFGDVLERAGFGEGGSLSDVAPFLYGDKGLMSRGGFFDFTTRGAMGFALDIAADPLTYLTFGAGSVASQSRKAGKYFLSKEGAAHLDDLIVQTMRANGLTDDIIARGGAAEFEKMDALRRGAEEFVEEEITNGAKQYLDKGGMKFFGHTIVPGEAIRGPARSVNQAVFQWLDGTSRGRKLIRFAGDTKEALGKAFIPHYAIRNNPKFVRMLQRYEAGHIHGRAKVKDMLEDVFYGTTNDEAEIIVRAIDEGTTGQLPKKLKTITDRIGIIHREWADKEISKGLLHDVHANYILHMYENTPEEVAAIMAKLKTTKLPQGLGGSQLQREFAMLKAAEAEGLRPILDARELLLRRGYRHADAMNTKAFLEEVVSEFGILPSQLPGFSTQTAKDFAMIKSEVKKIDKAWRKGNKANKSLRPAPKLSEKFLDGLSDEGKIEAINTMFRRARDQKEWNDLYVTYEKKYGQFFHTMTPTSVKRMLGPNGERMAQISGFADLRNIWLPENIAQAIAEHGRSFLNPELAKGVLRAYDVFSNTWKKGVTVLWPGFHFRNAYSNVVQSATDIGLNALNPAMYGDALRIMADGKLGTGKLVSRAGRTLSDSEVLYYAEKYGVLADPRDLFESIGERVKLPTTTAGKAKEMLMSASGHVENTSRMTAFVSHLKAGLGPEEAAQRVKKFLFDYRSLTPFERDFMKRYIPFYTWTRKNIALQLENLYRRPGAVATQAKILNRDQMTPDMLPKFLRGEAVFNMVEEDGKLKTVRGVDFPIADLNLFWNDGDEGFLARVMNMTGPLPKLVTELAYDRQLFTNKKISEDSRLKGIGVFLDEVVNKKLGGKAVTDWIGFNKTKNIKTGKVEYHIEHPVALYVLIKSWALSRAYTTGDRLLADKRLMTEGDFGSADWTGLITGVSLQDVDVQHVQQNMKYEEMERLRGILIRRGLRKRLDKTFKAAETVRD